MVQEAPAETNPDATKADGVGEALLAEAFSAGKDAVQSARRRRSGDNSSSSRGGFVLRGRVSILIPTYQRRDQVVQLLRSLQGLEVPFDRLDVVVVDNGSADGTSEALGSEFGKNVTVLRHAQNMGGSGGFRTAMRHALAVLNNEYIWLLDDDVTVAPDCLSRLLESARKLDRRGQKWGAIGSLMANRENPETVTETGAYIDWIRSRICPYQGGKSLGQIRPELLKVEFCAAASLLTRRSIIREVGFFEDLFIHFDDVDWCYRLGRGGYGVYCDTRSVIFHATARDKPVTWARYYDVRNFLWLCRRHSPMSLPFAYWKFWRMYWYFRIHGFEGTAQLVSAAIKDSRKNVLGRKDDIEVESYCPISALLLEDLSGPMIGIFKDIDEFEHTSQLVPLDFWQGATVILYHSSGPSGRHHRWPAVHWVVPKRRSKWSQLEVCWKQLRLTRKPSQTVIVGDSFRSKVILPTFGRAYYVNPNVQGFVAIGF